MNSNHTKTKLLRYSYCSELVVSRKGILRVCFIIQNDFYHYKPKINQLNQ